MSQFTKVQVLVVEDEDLNKDLEWHQENINNNLVIHRLVLKTALAKPKKWLLKLKHLRVKAEELHISHSFDLVHISVAWNMAIIGRRISGDLEIPFYITEHSTYFLSKKKFNYKKHMAYQAMRKAKAVFVVSDELRQHFQSKGVVNCSIIPNFINAELDQYTVSESRPYCFAHVTNWDIERKGTLEVLEAYRKIRETQECKMILIANKVEMNDMGLSKTDLSQLDIELYPGFAEPSEYYSCLSKAHCLVNFSNKETFGISVLEAVKMGLYTIYTRSGGPERFMREPWGAAMDVGDTAGLERNMEIAINEQKVIHSQVGERAQLFSAEEIFEEHIKVYNG